MGQSRLVAQVAKTHLRARFHAARPTRCTPPRADYVPTSEYEGMQLENQALKEQLIHCLEELASREREVSELHDTSLKYHTKMQTFADQVKLLYREYSGAVDFWKVEKNLLEKRVRRGEPHMCTCTPSLQKR